MEPSKTIAPKMNRKPLHTLQPAANNKKILVGARSFRSTKSKETKMNQNQKETMKKDVPMYTKVTKKSKAVQTAQEEKIKIEAEDLTSDTPSENYWQLLSQQRRIALLDVLEENKKLVQSIEKLEEENHVYKEMLDEMRTLVEVLQEQNEDDRNNVNNSLDNDTL